MTAASTESPFSLNTRFGKFIDFHFSPSIIHFENLINNRLNHSLIDVFDVRNYVTPKLARRRFKRQVATDYAAFHFFSSASLLMNGLNKSIGIGRKVVVLCSLEISRMVCRKRSCRAIGSLLINAAACTIFSAA